jgi:hypothetical protein
MWYASDSHVSIVLGTAGMHTPNSDEPGNNVPNPHTEDDIGSVIARQLTGELYCIGCGYNLHGLSIRSNCSECGMPVRATILGIVDPHADELVPLFAPKVTAIGLNAWSFGALGAVLVIWISRAAEVMTDVLGTSWGFRSAAWMGMTLLLISMMGALTMIRPHRGVLRSEAIRSALGVSLYGPLLFVYFTIYYSVDSTSPSPLLSPGDSALQRSVLRIVMFLLVAGIVWGLRPRAIGLAVRSVVVRTGRVDRQSLLAVLASLAIAGLGDLIHVVSFFISFGIDDVLSIVAVVVISLGSVLFTAGMVNICIDTVRLFPVLIRPGVGLSDIFETNRQRSERVS